MSTNYNIDITPLNIQVDIKTGVLGATKAENIEVSTVNFNNNFDSSDTDVQTVLETIDQLVLAGIDQADQINVDTNYFSGNLSSADSNVQSALETLDQLDIPEIPSSYNANEIVVDTSYFSNHLDSSNTTVQAALETLDQLEISTAPTIDSATIATAGTLDLTEDDETYQFINPTHVCRVNLPLNLSTNKEFIIFNVKSGAWVYDKIAVCTALDNPAPDTNQYFTYLFAGMIGQYLYRKETDTWYYIPLISHVTARTGVDTFVRYTEGFTLQGSGGGTGVGGLAIGNLATGRDQGCAVGPYIADAYNSGCAFGYNTHAHDRGATFGSHSSASINGSSLGYSANSQNNGTSIGYKTKALKQYGSAIAYASTQERYGGHAKSGDHLETSKFHIEEVMWKGQTTDATETEIFLHGVASYRCDVLASSIIGFEIRVLGMDSTYAKIYDAKIEGTIVRDASNNVSIIGSNLTTELNNTDSWTATATAYVHTDDQGYLVIKVTGGASDTVYWGAKGILTDRRI